MPNLPPGTMLVHNRSVLTAVVVLPDGSTTAHPLPEAGAVGIGRSDDNGIAIADPSISRRHALLHLGPPPALEDLGSSNGTALRGTQHQGGDTVRLLERRLQPGERVEIGPGDLIHVGSAVILLQPGRAEARKAPRAASALPANVVLADPAMRDLHQLAARIARGNIAVLLLGETGAGKDVVAEAIHRASPRAKRPLVKLNCAALPEALLESELFGHERGAFTGAAAAKQGLLETAEGGTILLDEVGELSPATQAKLLRVLEDGQLLRVGAVRARPVDVRVISATNRDLAVEVERGGFRRDLYFRLAGACLVVPPLRQRPSEIEPLARTFLTKACEQIGREPPELGRDAKARLEAYGWPGNVRELRNVMERAALVCDGPVVSPQHLDLRAPAPETRQLGLRGDMADIEKQRIAEALEQTGGNQSEAARRLGMPRRTLVKRLAQYGLGRRRGP